MPSSGANFSSFTNVLTNKLKALESDLKKRGFLPRSTTFSKSQLLITSLAFVLLVVGLISAVLLVGVEQDVRQQAAGSVYRNEPCLSTQENDTFCSEGEILRCSNGRWRGTGRTCGVTGPTAAPTNEPASNTTILQGTICGIDEPLDGDGKCRIYPAQGINEN